MEKGYTLITGAASDIGKEVCFNISGNRPLILHGRDKLKLEKLKSELPDSQNHIVWTYDFTSSDNVYDDFLNFIECSNIYIENIIHIAGIAEFFPVHLLNRKNIKTSFDVNFFSILDILCIIFKKKYRSFVKSIILISSVSVHSASGKGMGAYISSKSALEMYAKSVAAEIAPVRINSIALGGIKTSKQDGISLSLNDSSDAYPLGIGSPKNVADMVLFLLSDNSSWVTGQTFILDGGYSVFRGS